MTDYTVNVNGMEGYRFTLKLKVKHFRQYDGRVARTNGGHTAIFDKDSGLVFSSKCRDDEQFSRRKGILTCIQKMLQCQAFQCGTSKINYWIIDAKFNDNGCEVFIDVAPESIKFWWLSKHGIGLGSGLYA